MCFSLLEEPPSRERRKREEKKSSGTKQISLHNAISTVSLVHFIKAPFHPNEFQLKFNLVNVKKRPACDTRQTNSMMPTVTMLTTHKNIKCLFILPTFGLVKNVGINLIPANGILFSMPFQVVFTEFRKLTLYFCCSSRRFCYRALLVLNFRLRFSWFLFHLQSMDSKISFQNWGIMKNVWCCILIINLFRPKRKKNAKIWRETSILGQQTVNIWPIHTELQTNWNVHFSHPFLNYSNSDFIYSVFGECGA